MPKLDYHALGLKPTYTFQNLVVGPHNQMAAAAAMEVAKAPGETYNPLFVYGTAGIGKTHLMQAVAHAMLAENPAAKVKYISAERFTSEVIAAVADDNLMAIRQHYSELQLFIVDDIQFLTESKATQEEFFHVFNNLHQKNCQVIMAADRPPNQLTGLDQTIRSRLEWGLAVDIRIPDVTTRVEILKIKQQVQGLNLSDDMLRYAAEYMKSNVRELEGFLKRLHAYVTLSHQQLNGELVKQVLHEVVPAGTQTAPPPLEAFRRPDPPPPENVVMPSVAEKPVVEEVRQILSATGNGPQRAAPLEKISSELKSSIPPPQAAPPPASPAKKSPNGETPDAAKTNAQPPPASTAAAQQFSVISPDPPPVFPGDIDEELPSGHKEIGAVFFYPSRNEKHLDTVHRKFQEVIKKHKLKFRLKKIHSHGYDTRGKVNYSNFVEVCKQYKVPVAIVIGPPPDGFVTEHDFHELLAVTLDVQGISLQLINWNEIDKDYRYLNLALDIALVRSR